MGSEAQEVNKVLGLLRNAFNLYIEINSEANPVDFDKLFDSMGAPAINHLSTGQHADADYAIFLDSTVHPLLRTVQSKSACITLANLIRLAATVNAKSESAEGSPSVPTESFQRTNEQRKYLVQPYDSDRVCLLLRDRI